MSKQVYEVSDKTKNILDVIESIINQFNSDLTPIDLLMNKFLYEIEEYKNITIYRYVHYLKQVISGIATIEEPFTNEAKFKRYQYEAYRDFGVYVELNKTDIRNITKKDFEEDLKETLKKWMD